jgi:S1-C subfamily serine protease
MLSKSANIQSLGTTLVLVALLTGCSSTPPLLPSPSNSEETVGGVLSGGELSESEWQEVLSKAQASVFMVKVETCDYEATGSGFFVGNVFLTNRHVVEDAILVYLESASGIELPVDSWGYMEDVDLAWIKVKADSPRLKLASSDVTSGDLVANLGFPLGGKLTEERGRVVKLIDTQYPGYAESDLVGVTSEALPGNSGGPLLDRNGDVIGVVVALDRSESLILAIPLDDVRTFLSDNPALVAPASCD